MIMVLSLLFGHKERDLKSSPVRVRFQLLTKLLFAVLLYILAVLHVVIDPCGCIFLKPIIGCLLETNVIAHHFALEPFVAVDLFHNLFNLKEFFTVNHGVILSFWIVGILITDIFFVK